ncbi:MAG TPA: OsmC family protein [Patescibacteria group bacterium]|nr:OsmC family protein [Patescibacteria group bacterium]
MKITQVAGHQFKAEYKGVELVSGKVGEGSSYVGMSPGSLMVAALGMCTAMHIEGYLSKEGIEYDGIEIDVKNRYERNPPRAAGFILTVKVNGELTEEQRKGVLEEAGRCYVGNSMRGGPEITVNLQ